MAAVTSEALVLTVAHRYTAVLTHRPDLARQERERDSSCHVGWRWFAKGNYCLVGGPPVGGLAQVGGAAVSADEPLPFPGT